MNAIKIANPEMADRADIHTGLIFSDVRVGVLEAGKQKMEFTTVSRQEGAR